MAKVHGVGPSPFVRKVRAALHEKGIPYELVPVNPFARPPGFQRLSPLREVPVFEDDDGRCVADSFVIVAYLERTRPEPALYPADARELALALALEEVSDTELGTALGTAFRERRVKPRVLDQECDETEVTRVLQTVLPPFSTTSKPWSPVPRVS